MNIITAFESFGYLVQNYQDEARNKNMVESFGTALENIDKYHQRSGLDVPRIRSFWTNFVSSLTPEEWDQMLYAILSKYVHLSDDDRSIDCQDINQKGLCDDVLEQYYC